MKTEPTLGTLKYIKDTLTHFKKLKADIAVVRTVNERLVDWLVKTERLLGKRTVAETVCGVFKKIGVEIDERDVQTCHCLKEKEGTMVTFVSRKDCLQILRVKKELKSLDPTELDFPKTSTFLLTKVPYYRGIWDKFKKLSGIQKIHQFYMISGLIRVK